MLKISYSKLALMLMLTVGITGAAVYSLNSFSQAVPYAEQNRLSGVDYVAIESNSYSEARKIQNVFKVVALYGDRQFHALRVLNSRENLVRVSGADAILTEPIFDPFSVLIVPSPMDDQRWVTAIVFKKEYRDLESPIQSLMDNIQDLLDQGVKHDVYNQELRVGYTSASRYKGRMKFVSSNRD